MASQTRQYYFGQQGMDVPVRYSVHKVIGRGAYGLVCSAVDTHTGDQVAIKKIGRVFDDLVDAKRILRELKLLTYVKHPNLLGLKGIVRPPDPDNFTDVYFITEFMDSDLNFVLKSKHIRLVEEHCQYFIFQLAAGLQYLHASGILHRDLKPANLLTNSDCELKICDFGLARARGSKMTDYVVTRWYRPPELLLVCEGYTSAIDMWAVGCLTYEVFTRKPLFPGKDYIHQISLIVDCLGNPTGDDLKAVTSPEAKRFVESIPPRESVRWDDMMPQAGDEVRDFVKKLLTYNPDKRMTAYEAVRHYWFGSYSEGDAAGYGNPPREFIFEQEDRTLDEPTLRRLFWDEINSWIQANP